MRIFVAGASGVIGVRLVPLLAAAGHEVAGMTRSPEKLDRLSALGAEPILCDVYDAARLRGPQPKTTSPASPPQLPPPSLAPTARGHSATCRSSSNSMASCIATPLRGPTTRWSRELRRPHASPRSWLALTHG
ncbi:MAG: NAD(P)H-binding protein [Solirubrobacteraceae bacterium]